ncbi:MAG: site-2 protease family protein [bacterium]
MPIQWLFSQPIFFLLWIFAIVITLAMHEFFHAATATYFGDDTAKMQGRLTLNPLKHLDPVGFLMLVFIGFGWAKPVPVNPYNLRNRRWSMGLIAAAGPFSNLLGVIIFGLLLKFFDPILGPVNLLIILLYLLVTVNTILMTFNLLPIPPLDGSNVLFAILPDKYNQFKMWLSQNGPWVLLGLILADDLLNLGIFNFLFQFVLRSIGLILNINF